jgi:hypothetical protein
MIALLMIIVQKTQPFLTTINLLKNKKGDIRKRRATEYRRMN